jgi:creatinine amidohydrolase
MTCCSRTYYANRVLQSSNVVLAPVINYSFYPAFVEYAGSTMLRLETARDMIVDICRSLARHGPKRFIFGDATLATRDKGRRVVEAHVLDLLAEIDALRKTPIPAP